MQDKLSTPVQLTDSELDHVAAGILNGGLINVDVTDVANNVDIVKNVNVDVAAAVAVLGGAGAVSGTVL